LRTFPAWGPVRALDSMYVRGDMHIVDVRTPRLALARIASDHLPLVADVRVASGPAAQVTGSSTH
jgi:endonuclease/exonuclease/phosphatase family metal-dependent hydrolase